MVDLPIMLATFAVGFAATFLFVATGGVGMITIPALIFLGLSPQAAIATDVFALLGGRIGGMLGLRREGMLDMRLGLRLGAISSAGAIAGAFTLLSVPEALMKRLLSGLLVLLLLLLVLRPEVGVASADPLSRRRTLLGSALFFPIGFWGTLVGAGFLNMGSAVLLLVFRKTFLESAGVLTLVGLGVGLVGLVVFGVRGLIVWQLGCAMLAGKALGGYLGARYAVGAGEGRVRVLFIAVVLASSLRLYMN